MFWSVPLLPVKVVYYHWFVRLTVELKIRTKSYVLGCPTPPKQCLLNSAFDNSPPHAVQLVGQIPLPLVYKLNLGAKLSKGGWLVDVKMVGQLVGWQAGWLAGCLAGCLFVWLVCWLFRWLTGWLFSCCFLTCLLTTLLSWLNNQKPDSIEKFLFITCFIVICG